MSLSTRVSLFFLCMLVCILLGFSLGIYMLAREHFLHEVEEELEAVLQTLVAAVEVGPDSVEWEPGDRRPMTVDIHHGSELTWVVHDDHGRVIQQSSPHLAPGFADALKTLQASIPPENDSREHRHDRWYLQQRWIRPKNMQPPNSAPNKHRELCITAGLTYEPTLTNLQYLRWMLFGISLAIFIPVLMIGHFICKKALMPITQMAQATKAIHSEQLDQRLPVPASRDELYELSQSFNSLLDRLQVSFERQKRFTGDASHQLRTPMAAILGNVEVTLRRERSVAEYQQTLQLVEARAQHVNRIIEALLFLSRADAEVQMSNDEQVELSQWLSNHLEDWSAHQRFGDLHFNSTSGSLEVLTHSALLGELLAILVDNACRYSEAGTPIEITLRRVNEHAELTIQDHGMGIARDDVEKIFEPFYRSNQSSREHRQGVGLGLSIAKRIAHALRLSLTVNSTLGHGTTFVVRFESQSVATQDDE